MSDELVPLPDQVRALPAPDVVGSALQEALKTRVAAERAARGDVRQPEDSYALTRALSGAHELLSEYGAQFAKAARLARTEMDTELRIAVGEQEEIPLGKLVVPDGDVTITLAPAHGNEHSIDQPSILAVVLADAVAQARGTEPAQEPDEPDDVYDDRYWRWFAAVIEQVLAAAFTLGTYEMQVSKVRAYAADLAARHEDSMSAVVASAVETSRRYRGVKYERKAPS